MKTLIWLDNLKERSGGPPTYVYNLKKSVEINKLSDIIHFSSDFKKINTDIRFDKKILKNIYDYIPEKIRINLSLKRYFKWISDYYESDPLIDYNQYDVIHFHSTVDLYRSIKHLESFKGRVLLTSHTPKAPFLERIEDVLKSNIKLVSKKNIDKLILIDEKAIERADYLIFPCQDAMEPYFNTWNNFGRLIENKSIEYLLTASPSAIVKKSYHEIRKELNIPDDAFVFVYAGRHNEVKGYDILKKAAQIIFENNNSPLIYFLILGKEEPLKGLEHPNWIEIGWTNKPHDYINAGDVFILPNRETYFDLILLEVLSLKKVVILSNSGGNRFFLQNSNKGFFYIENLDAISLATIIKDVSKISKTYINDLGKNNYSVFQNNFTIESFAKNYVKLLENI